MADSITDEQAVMEDESIAEVDIKMKGPGFLDNLKKSYMNKLKGKKIEGVIKEIYADKSINGKRVYTGVVKVSISMNEKTLIIPMKYHYKKDHFKATGTIDLFDFQGQNFEK